MILIADSGSTKTDWCVVENGVPVSYTHLELALMLNGEKMLKDGEQCNLHVVKMKGWKRKMDYTPVSYTHLDVYKRQM